MHSEADPNPYAPPKSPLQRVLHEDWVKGAVWRDGNKLIIGRNAELPPRCFLTGEDTDCAVEIRAIWPPSLFSSLYVIPQTFRDVKLSVPIARRLLLCHLRKTRSAALATVLLMIVCVLFVVSTVGVGNYPEFLIVAACSFVLALLGLRLASSDPLRLHIEQLAGNTLVLGQVHPRCLEGLPSLAESGIPIGRDAGR